MHPADQSDLQAISQASYFIASIFLGRGQFVKSEQTYLADARLTAKRMETYYRNGRGGMVYAVLPSGRSVLVPNEYQPKEREMEKAVNIGEEIPGFLKKDKAPVLPAAKKKAVSPKRAPAVKVGKAKKTKVTKPPKIKTAKLAKAPKPPKAAKAPRVATGKRAAILEAAKRGEMPTPPDFSANTHKPHRKRLDEVIALAKARDVKGLKAFKINPVSSSRIAIDRYRLLAVTALEAKAA